MSACIHVIGGGLAGLSAALEAAATGRRVVLYEAGPACGGRARSYEDRQLGCRIDNGNHLLLSANHATFDYLDRIGARHTLSGPGVPIFPFSDVSMPGAGLHWTLRLSHGRIPWWVLDPRKRVPGMKLRELASMLRMLRAGEGVTVSECLAPGMLADRLLVPLSVSVLNTRPEAGSAMLMAAMMRESLTAGGDACVPWFPKLGLSESLIDPALARLQADGAAIRTGCRVSGLGTDASGGIARLLLPDGEQALGPDDTVVLAVTAPVAAELLAGPLPGLALPDSFESILNLHYRIALQDALGGDLARAGFAGIVGGLAEWVFVKPDVVSVTISAANHLAQRDNASVATQVWREISTVLQPALRPARRRPAPGDAATVVSLPSAPPPYRVLREKRATFAATAAQQKLRPGSRTLSRNLFLAGDWTDTGLPATIEGAIRSGKAAIRALAHA